jgi:hypothetical protein
VALRGPAWLDTVRLDLEGGNMASIDLAALRLVKVPDAAPPYDCEAHGASCPELRDPFGADAPDGVADSVDLPGPEGPRPDREGRVPGPAGTVSPAAPAVAQAPAATVAWPRQSAQVMVEILTGVRPVRQVVPWTTDRAMAQIRGLVPDFTSDRRPRIQRVVMSRPAAGVVEMAVVAFIGLRTRALAMRFEHVAARPAASGLPPRPARWLCTAIEAG